MSLIAGNLGVVQRTLDAESMIWGVCAGAAAHLYGNRRPIQDVDILVGTGQLPLVVKLLHRQQKVVQYDGGRILWRGIKLFDDLAIRKGATVYPFILDALMSAHMRRISLLGALVQVLSPEDVVVHKLLLDRGAEQNKHDVIDVTGIIRRQQLDISYLKQRMELMRVGGALDARLAELGVSLV